MLDRVLGGLLDLVLVVWLGCGLLLDQIGGAPPAPGPYDAIVVAGAGVQEGGVPSPALWHRTRLGADLWRAGMAPRLALTGGVGDWPPAESAVAEALAVEWGVPADAVVTEALSTSTEGNAREARAMLGDARILVVTDRYHVMRCRRVFGRYFDDVEGAGAVTPWRVRARGSLREVLAVTLYAVTGRL